MRSFYPVFNTDTAIRATPLPEQGNEGEETLAAAARAFQEEASGKTDIATLGDNSPPVVSSYVPTARNPEELEKEAASIANDLVQWGLKGEMDLTAKLATMCADIAFLGTKELVATMAGAVKIEATFAPLSTNRELFKQIKAQGEQMLIRGNPGVAEFPSVMVTLDGAVRKACLLVYGFAKIALFPLKDTGNGVPVINKRVPGMALDKMPDYDKTKYGQAIAVPYNVWCPVIYNVVEQPGKPGMYHRKPFAGPIEGWETDGAVYFKPNNDNDVLYFVSTQNATVLYQRYMEHEPDASFTKDEMGFYKAKGRTTGGSQAQAETLPGARAPAPSTEAAAQAVADAMVTNDGTDATGRSDTGNARPDGAKSPFAAMRDYVKALPALEASADSPILGMLEGMRFAFDNDKVAVSPGVLARVAETATDAFQHILDNYDGETAKPSYAVMKHWANLYEQLGDFLKVEEGVVRFRPQDKGWKDEVRLAPKVLPVNGKVAEPDALQMNTSA